MTNADAVIRETKFREALSLFLPKKAPSGFLANYNGDLQINILPKIGATFTLFDKGLRPNYQNQLPAEIWEEAKNIFIKIYKKGKF